MIKKNKGLQKETHALIRNTINTSSPQPIYSSCACRQKTFKAGNSQHPTSEHSLSRQGGLEFGRRFAGVAVLVLKLQWDVEWHCYLEWPFQQPHSETLRLALCFTVNHSKKVRQRGMTFFTCISCKRMLKKSKGFPRWLQQS